MRVSPEAADDVGSHPFPMAGDGLFVAPPEGPYLRTTIVEASKAEAIFEDAEGLFWRMRSAGQGSSLAEIGVPRKVQVWIVDGMVTRAAAGEVATAAANSEGLKS